MHDIDGIVRTQGLAQDICNPGALQDRTDRATSDNTSTGRGRAKQNHTCGLLPKNLKPSPRPPHIRAWSKLVPWQRDYETNRMVTLAAMPHQRQVRKRVPFLPVFAPCPSGRR